jgi:hypothetical protein
MYPTIWPGISSSVASAIAPGQEGGGEAPCVAVQATDHCHAHTHTRTHTGRLGDKLAHGNELDDVASHLAAAAVDERGHVGIEALHQREVCVADADDNNRQGQHGRSDNHIDGRVHIGDDAISQDEANLKGAGGGFHFPVDFSFFLLTHTAANY